MTDVKIEGGEFIEREIQRPPEDTPGFVAQDATASAQSDLAETPLGAPPTDYDVRSTYDSRPVNGYDFMIAVTAAAEGGNTFTMEFEVRQGFVGVLREFSHFFTDNPQPAVINRAEVLATLRRNGTDVLDNADIPVGVSSDSIWKGFVIADEFNTLGVRIVLQGLLTAAECVAVFYGNYLLKTGVASPFEIANRTKGGCLPALPTLPPPRMAPMLPPILAPVMAPPSVAAPSLRVPPFRVQWMRPLVAHSARGAGRAPVSKVYPAYANGKPLSQSDQAQYAEWLAANKPA